MTQEDFQVITENGRFLGPTGEFNRLQFRSMMKVWAFGLGVHDLTGLGFSAMRNCSWAQ